jgi:hypothetical protein
MNAEASEAKFDDLVIDALDRGIPAELVTRLQDIWDTAKIIAGEVIAIGRIVVNQIFDFLKRNPKLSIGLAVGASVAVLVGGIPIFGSLLQPLSSWVATTYGAGVGAAMEQGDYSGSPFTAAIELASKFYELLILVFRSVVAYLSAA